MKKEIKKGLLLFSSLLILVSFVSKTSAFNYTANIPNLYLGFIMSTQPNVYGTNTTCY